MKSLKHSCKKSVLYFTLLRNIIRKSIVCGYSRQLFVMEVEVTFIPKYDIGKIFGALRRIVLQRELSPRDI